MAIVTVTRGVTNIYNNQVLTAAAADTVSNAYDIGTKLRASLAIRLVNGATGPTAQAQVQISVSADNNRYYSLGGPLGGGTANYNAGTGAGVSEWPIEIPADFRYVKIAAGKNTGQDVTLTVDLVTTDNALIV